MMTEATPKQVIEFMLCVDQLRAEREQMRSEIARLASLGDSIGADNQRLANEIAKLKAGAAHTAGFLDGIAARIEGWVRWDNGEGDVGSYIKAVEDCRTMADSIKRCMLG